MCDGSLALRATLGFPELVSPSFMICVKLLGVCSLGLLHGVSWARGCW